MKSGKIQYVFFGEQRSREKNYVITYTGWLSFLKACYKVFRSGCDKAYILPDRKASIVSHDYTPF